MGAEGQPGPEGECAYSAQIAADIAKNDRAAQRRQARFAPDNFGQ
jgi:hypothetical protein